MKKRGKAKKEYWRTVEKVTHLNSYLSHWKKRTHRILDFENVLKSSISIREVLEWTSLIWDGPNGDLCAVTATVQWLSEQENLIARAPLIVNAVRILEGDVLPKYTNARWQTR